MGNVTASSSVKVFQTMIERERERDRFAWRQYRGLLSQTFFCAALTSREVLGIPAGWASHRLLSTTYIRGERQKEYWEFYRSEVRDNFLWISIIGVEIACAARELFSWEFASSEISSRTIGCKNCLKRRWLPADTLTVNISAWTVTSR